MSAMDGSGREGDTLPLYPNRLREIREAKGMTLAEVAAAAGGKTTPKTISRLERGEMRLSVPWMNRLAPVFGVKPAELLSEDGAKAQTVPVVGYVGAGETVYNFTDPEGGLEHVRPPPGAEESVAVVVRGDSMWPAYQPDDLLFFLPADYVRPDAVGRDCIVQVKNGPTYIKRLERGSRPGVYRLSSYKALPIDDVEVVWASRVRWIERR
jgi:SOS-response transcriptional repressor LexA